MTGDAKTNPWVLLGGAIAAGLFSGGGTGVALNGDKFTATDAAQMEARLQRQIAEVATNVALLTQSLDFESQTREAIDNGRAVQYEQLRNRIAVMEDRIDD